MTYNLEKAIIYKIDIFDLLFIIKIYNNFLVNYNFL